MKIGGDRIIIQTEVPEAIESQLSAGQNITDLEVWTDGGDHIGRVVDVCFDQSTGQVQQYLFALKEKEEKAVSDDQLVDDVADDRADCRAVWRGFGLIWTWLAKGSDKTTTVFMILPQAIISAGRKRMMIAEEDAQRAQSYDQPLDLSGA